MDSTCMGTALRERRRSQSVSSTSIVSAPMQAQSASMPPAAADVDEVSVHWSSVESVVSRMLDLVAALTLAVVAFPVVLVVAVLVKGASRGPVLYEQERVGAGGVPFTMYKFRTMRVGTDVEIRSDPQQWAAFEAGAFKLPADDPRITRVGRWLRASSLDELPQLLNVLEGNMSAVGIRPVEPEQLRTRPADYRAVYGSRRPGITGLWQVEGRSSGDEERRLEFDRRYVDNWSIRGDLALLARTPLAVLRVRRPA